MHCITFVYKKEKKETSKVTFRTITSLWVVFSLSLPCLKLGHVSNLLCGGMAWHDMAGVFFFLPAEYHGKEASASRESQQQWEHPKNNFGYEQEVALHVYHTLICVHFFDIHFMTIVRIFLMIAGSPLSSKQIHPYFTCWAKQNKRT